MLSDFWKQKPHKTFQSFTVKPIKTLAMNLNRLQTGRGGAVLIKNDAAFTT